MTQRRQQSSRTTLTNREEAFCHNIACGGMTQYDAFIEAGYSSRQKRSAIDSNASILAHKAKIIQRIAELRRTTNDATIATVVERKQILSEIIRGKVSDFITNDNRVHVTPESLNASSVAEVVVTEDQVGHGDDAYFRVVTRIKLRDPIAAITELNKMDGVYKEPNLTLNQLNVDNRQVRIGEIKIGSATLKDALKALLEAGAIEVRGNGHSPALLEQVHTDNPHS